MTKKKSGGETGTLSTKRVGIRSRAAAVVPEESFPEVVRIIELARNLASRDWGVALV